MAEGVLYRKCSHCGELNGDPHAPGCGYSVQPLDGTERGWFCPSSLPRPALHSSEVRLYHRCQRAWSYAHQFRRVPKERSEALEVGTLIHLWLAWFWSGKQGPAPLPEHPIARACCIAYEAYYACPPDHAVWEVEVPFTATIAGVPVAGTLDGLLYIPGRNRKLCEHKSTSEDISSGSVYWRRVATTDVQISLYHAAFPDAEIIYDVIRKPDVERSKVPILDADGLKIVLDADGNRVQNKTKPYGWKQTPEHAKGYYLKTRDETDDELCARALALIVECPEKYFQRQKVVRLEVEHEAFARDLVSVQRLTQGKDFPRNPDSCFVYGKRCGYWAVCWEGGSLDDPEFQNQDENR